MRGVSQIVAVLALVGVAVVLAGVVLMIGKGYLEGHPATVTVKCTATESGQNWVVVVDVVAVGEEVKITSVVPLKGGDAVPVIVSDVPSTSAERLMATLVTTDLPDTVRVETSAGVTWCGVEPE